MPSPEGLQVANKFTIAMPSVAQLGLNTQPFERDNSLACKPCRADQILLEGQLRLVRVTQTDQVPECWHSFQDLVGWAGGDIQAEKKSCHNRKGFASGFERFGKFKTIFGPIALTVKNDKGRLRIAIRLLHQNFDFPACLGPGILVFLHEKACSCNARRLVPEMVKFQGSIEKRQELAGVFGAMPETGDPEVIYAVDDARLSLVSENTALWTSVEQDLQLAQATTATSMQERVRACLIGAIGDGDPSIAYICERLSRSRTGLLRELQAEGVTFQGILTDTRKSLALRYLRNSDMPVKQVASLLAYRDTNAFHRAFRAWTGQTPARVRATQDDACQV